MLLNSKIILDEQDNDLLCHKWTPLKSKHLTYAKSHIDGKNTLLHRLVAVRMQGEFSGIVDHINGNTLDCSRSNLQVCTHQQNLMKQRKQINSKSKYKGVMPFRGKWRARITLNAKTFHLGVFENEDDAAIAYNKKAVELFGKFVNLNKVDHV